jgi:cell division protein FtsZ
MNPIPPLNPDAGLLFLGVGRAGTKIVRALAALELAGTRFACLSTAEFPAEVAGVNDLPFGLEVTRGFGCGGDVAHGRQAAEQDIAALRQAVAGARVVVVVTGLGGGTGGGAAPVVAKLARDAGALVVTLATLPFGFEAPLRQANAKASLQALRAASDVVLCLSNAAAARMLDEKTRLPEVMANSNAVIADTVRGLWRMLTCSGLVPIGVATLERMLRGLHGESAFATVEGRGENRAREAYDQLQKHSFLQAEHSPSEAEVVLVNIAADGDLRLDELEWLQRQFQTHCEQARLVVGATDDPSLRGRIALTVIAARTGIVPVSSPVLAPVANPAAGLANPPPRFEPSAPEAPVIIDGLDLDTGAPVRGLAGLVKAGSEAVRRGASGKLAGKKKAEQQNFNFDIVSKGRFEHTESTYYQDQNLDEPTFLRRGITLN